VATAEAALVLIDSINSREHSYGILGMVCGTISLLGALGSFTYLAMNGHPKSATVVLGSTVLTVIGKMIGGRLASSPPEEKRHALPAESDPEVRAEADLR
jgi:hypothetical protein